MSELPKVCVILGAGASHDVHGEGSRIIDQQFQPPLAIDLFNIEKNNAYYDVLKNYQGALILAQQLATLIKYGQSSVEDELKKYSRHKNPQIREHFKHIPAYLRDLIHCSSTRYTRVPTSYIQLAVELLAEHPHDVLFLVLNYDNLLEKALVLFDREFRFDYINQYVSADRQAQVVKLHGSIDWFKPLTDDSDRTWFDVVKSVDVLKAVSEQYYIVKNNLSVVSERRLKNYWAYPVLTAPLASKGLNDAVCPQSHIGVAKEFLQDCQKFLIIGTSGLDDDLFDFLNLALKESTKRYHVHIVGSGGSTYQCVNRFRENVEVLSPFIFDENTFKAGFRVYLRSNHFQSFMEDNVYRD